MYERFRSHFINIPWLDAYIIFPSDLNPLAFILVLWNFYSENKRSLALELPLKNEEHIEIIDSCEATLTNGRETMKKANH